MRAIALLRRHRDYRLVVASGLVSMVGDWVLDVGLAYLVYDLTGSTLASGATLVAAFLPQVLLGSFAGVLVDRWDRRRTMIAANVLQAVGLLPLLAVGSGRIWIVYVVALWQGTLAQFSLPAEQALIPALVPEEDLLAANAVNAQARGLARLLGSTTGGVLAAWGGLTAVALVDAATFVAGAALVVTVRAGTRPPPDPADVPEVRRLLAEWREGLRLMTRTRGLRLLLVFVLVTSVGEGIFGTLFAPWVRDVARGDGRAFGYIVGAQSLGGIAGGFVAASLGARANPRTLFGWGAVAFGLLDTLLLTYPLLVPHPAPAVLVIALGGLPGALTVAGMVTLVQTLTEDRFRGRVLGAMGTAQAVSMMAGVALAATLGEVVGILPVIVLQGLGYVVGGALVLLTRP